MLIFYNIFNMYNLTKYHFYLIQSISYVSINIIVWLNRNLILINKIIKHNQVKSMCCGIKYLYLYIFINFSVFFFICH